MPDIWFTTDFHLGTRTSFGTELTRLRLVLSRPDCGELHTNRLVEIKLGGA